MLLTSRTATGLRGRMQIEIRDSGDSKLRIEKKLMQPSKSSRRTRHLAAGLPLGPRYSSWGRPMALRTTKPNEDAPRPCGAKPSGLSQWACGPRTMHEGARGSGPLFSGICAAPSTAPPGAYSWERACPSAMRVGVRLPRFKRPVESSKGQFQKEPGFSGKNAAFREMTNPDRT